MLATGHHTCSNFGGSATVLEECPFLSSHDKAQPKYLGTGYYFWDYDLDYAKTWGRKHYNNHFFVIACKLDLQKAIFLDLVGNREDMEWLMKQIAKLEEEGFDLTDFTLGTIIELLKSWSVDERDPLIFPYKAIRAVDINAIDTEQKLLKFVKARGSIMDLNPRFFICLTEITDVLLRSKDIVYDSSRER